MTGPAGDRRFLDLSHPIREGETTYPGLPTPRLFAHLTREDSRRDYAPGTEFLIGGIEMVGNTGTYLDSPFHRYADGGDLASLPLERLAELPVVVVRTAETGSRGVGVEELEGREVEGCAVLLHTGGDAGWGTPEYAVSAPFLSGEGADWLAGRGAALVGIDAVNIDAIDRGGERPAHSILLAAGIPVVEHLTRLGEVPEVGATFSAVPAPVVGLGTFPVRAYARIPDRRRVTD